MSILKKRFKEKRKEENQGFIGCKIPVNFSSYISLYANSKGISKSKIFRNLLIGWVNESRKELKDSMLIEDIAHKAYHIWKNPVARRKPFDLFKKNLEIELLNKGIKRKAVNEIIKIVNDEKTKDPEEN
ncbi:MAG: hypothetical protein ACOC2U_00155 [bacterium]